MLDLSSKVLCLTVNQRAQTPNSKILQSARDSGLYSPSAPPCGGVVDGDGGGVMVMAARRRRPSDGCGPLASNGAPNGTGGDLRKRARARFRRTGSLLPPENALALPANWLAAPARRTNGEPVVPVAAREEVLNELDVL